MGIFRSRQLLGNLDSPDSDFRFFSGLDFIGVLICDTDLLVEIRLDELKSFSYGLEKDFVEFRDHGARAQRLEQLPRSDQSCINYQGDYLPIYREEGYD